MASITNFMPGEILTAEKLNNAFNFLDSKISSLTSSIVERGYIDNAIAVANAATKAYADDKVAVVALNVTSLQTDVADVTNSVSALQSVVSELNSAMQSKASLSDVTSAVGVLESAIDSVNTTLQSKANSADVYLKVNTYSKSEVNNLYDVTPVLTGGTVIAHIKTPTGTKPLYAPAGSGGGSSGGSGVAFTSHIETVTGDAETDFNPVEEGLPIGPYEYIRFYLDNLDDIESGDLEGANVLFWAREYSEYDYEYEGPGSLDTTEDMFEVDDWGAVACIDPLLGLTTQQLSDRVCKFTFTRKDGTTVVPYFQATPGSNYIYVPMFGDTFDTQGTFNGFAEYSDILDSHTDGVYFGTASEMMPDPNMTVIVVFIDTRQYPSDPDKLDYLMEPITITSAAGTNNVDVIFNQTFDPTAPSHDINNAGVCALGSELIDENYLLVSFAYIHDADHTPTDIVWNIPTHYKAATPTFGSVFESRDAVIDITNLPQYYSYGTCMYSPFGRVEVALRVYDDPTVQADREREYAAAHGYWESYDNFSLKLLELSGGIDYLCRDLYNHPSYSDLWYATAPDAKHSQTLVSNKLRNFADGVPTMITAVDPVDDTLLEYEAESVADAFCHHAISIVGAILSTIISGGLDESDLQSAVAEALNADDEDSYVHDKLNSDDVSPRTGLDMRYRCVYKLAKFVQAVSPSGSGSSGTPGYIAASDNTMVIDMKHYVTEYDDYYHLKKPDITAINAEIGPNYKCGVIQRYVVHDIPYNVSGNTLNFNGATLKLYDDVYRASHQQDTMVVVDPKTGAYTQYSSVYGHGATFYYQSSIPSYLGVPSSGYKVWRNGLSDTLYSNFMSDKSELKAFISTGNVSLASNPSAPTKFTATVTEEFDSTLDAQLILDTAHSYAFIVVKTTVYDGTGNMYGHAVGPEYGHMIGVMYSPALYPDQPVPKILDNWNNVTHAFVDYYPTSLVVTKVEVPNV